MDDFDAEVAAARAEENQADARAQVAEVRAERQLAAAQRPEPSPADQAYANSIASGATHVLGMAIESLRLLRWRDVAIGEQLGGQLKGKELFCSQVLAGLAMKWTGGRWVFGVGIAEMLLGAARGIVGQVVEIKLKERDEERLKKAKDVTPAPAIHQPPAGGLEISLPASAYKPAGT